MAKALYGPSGFYRVHQPAEHFRTSVTATPVFSRAIARLLHAVDEALERPRSIDLVDVGAGSGELVAQVVDELDPAIRRRLNVTAVEIRPAPPEVPNDVRWTDALPRQIKGLIVANEYLDNVPCDVVAHEAGQLRYVLVDESGDESLGHEIASDHGEWFRTWWPMTSDVSRAEIGDQRDQAWTSLINALDRGVALAIDYGHVYSERASSAYAAGTLTGYRDGHQVVPIPDGSCDITAHVAIDACQEAGLQAGAEHTALMTQRDALDHLGTQGTVPDRSLATSDPVEYVRQLSEASSAAELRDPMSLGSFWWLLQSKGVPLPIGTGALSG